MGLGVKFNPDDTELTLVWVIEFWKSQRETLPIIHPNKRRLCECKEACKLSISDESF